MDSGGVFKYSCKTAGETLEWIHAIVNFLKPYRFFLDAHVVNFFKERLWEAVDKEWMDCLRKEPIDDLLRIPSGVIQDHWPASLKEFVLSVRSLSLLRDQADLQKALPGLHVASLNNILAQGMNHKKKHEIEALSAVISSIASRVGVDTIVDVGSGQGYLAQVLSFEYQLSVIAIDASSHHGRITDVRAERIKKYYAAKLRKSRLESRGLRTPKTVTCRVLSTDMLKALSYSLLLKDDENPDNNEGKVDEIPLEGSVGNELTSSLYPNGKPSLILAGLHACGDLSVTMLRTFIECADVRAVVSIGCCYNLLSEGIVESDTQCGFPMSKGVKSAGLLLGKNARDLACQSAERWRCLGEAAGLHNFELHAFRAAFQMVLFQHYPEVITKSPAIGRQGKALRRQHHHGILESSADIAESLSQKNCKKETGWSAISSTGSADTEEGSTCNVVAASFYEDSSHWSSRNCEAYHIDRYSMFVKFCLSGLHRLGLPSSQDIEFSGLWKQAEPFAELIGPYWTLRAALGPVLETLLLLDRLLFLQESNNTVEAVMLPIFDPVVSPRNVAFIAKKL